jgi:hypothetical protein
MKRVSLLDDDDPFNMLDSPQVIKEVEEVREAEE